MLGYNDIEIECMIKAVHAALLAIDHEKYPAVARHLYNTSEFIRGLQAEGWAGNEFNVR